MSDLRTAAQQALEALERYRQMMFAEAGCRWGGGDAAISTLRAALAQEQAEPLNLLDRAVQRRLAAQWGYVPAEQAEPAQAPYAWHYTNNAGASVWHRGPSNRLDADMQAARDYPHAHKVTPLYTAPPRRTMVPLTEGEIRRICDAHWCLRQLARAIEKASWEKNHG